MPRKPSPPRARRPIRLQSFLSDAGVASRRHAEQLILEGRVLVNDAVVERLPAFVDPAVDRVIVDGHPVRQQRAEYFLVNKPVGVLCTNHDPAGRTRAIDLLPQLPMQLFPVGRLDADSSGLLLMTNDGELAQRIMHPRYGVPKLYRVEVRGRVADDLPARMQKGVYLSEGRARADDVQILHVGRHTSVLMITLHEGKNRHIRRMLARFELPVKSLRRVQIGPLSIRGLPLGAARRLSDAELAALRDMVARPQAVATQPRTNRPPRTRTSAPTGPGSPAPRKPARERTAQDRPAAGARSRGRRQEAPRGRPAAAPRAPRRPGGPPRPPQRRIVSD